MSASNKRSLRMRTGPHDYGPREWCVFFFVLFQTAPLWCREVSFICSAVPQYVSTDSFMVASIDPIPVLSCPGADE